MEVANSVKVGRMLSNLGNEDFKALCSILTDELSLKLIKEIGGPHSPMAVDQLTAKGFHGDNALVRLYDLQRLGIFNSKMSPRGQDYVRVFGPTSIAKRIAKEVSGTEK